jgi:acetyl esterase/lipase
MKGRAVLAGLSVAGVLLVMVFAWVGARGPAAVLSQFTPAEGLRVIESVPYGDDARQRMDVYIPTATPPAAGGYPVVVFFYGGSWQSGRRQDYRFVARSLARRGMVVVVPDYRLYPQVTYPGFVRDAARAVALVLREATLWRGDPSRVFVMGHSAGAYNAAMVALDPRWLREAGVPASRHLAGWIGLAGPYDFLPITQEDVKPIFHFPNSPPDSQPIAYVSPSAPPCFLGAALRDDLVNPRRNTLALAHRLRADGVPVDERVYSGVNHITLIGAFAWPLRRLAPVLRDVSRFVLHTGEHAPRARADALLDSLASAGPATASGASDAQG